MEILFIASATPAKSRRALNALHARFPEASIAIALCPEFESLLESSERERVVFRAGSGEPRLRFVWSSRDYGYEWIAAIWGGDRAYLTMKLAAFLVQPRKALLCCNENGDAFEWRWGNRRTILRHLQWRLECRSPGSGWLVAAGAFSLRVLQICVGEPLGLLLLLARTSVLLMTYLLMRVAHRGHLEDPL